jgi:hypothetical protein
MKEFRSNRLRVWENINRTMQEFKVLLLGYRSYTALLSQTGTDAPVATVLENTLGGAVVWSYDGVGDYYGTLTGAFPDSNKLFIIYGSPSSQGTFIQSGYNNVNSVFLATFNNSVTDTDGLLDHTPIEIRVYN